MKIPRVIGVTALLLGLLVAILAMMQQVAEAQGVVITPGAGAVGGVQSGAQTSTGSAPREGDAAAAKQGAGGATGTLADARAFAAKGRLDQAMAILDESEKASPEEPGVERLRGVIFYQKDSLAAAETAFGKAVEQDPSDRESEQMRGITLYRLGRPAEAIPLLEKGRKPLPQDREHPDSTALDVEKTGGGVAKTNVDPEYVLGLCYTDAKRYDDARRAFAEQFGFGPDSAEAYLVTARLFLRREFEEEADKFAHKALELNPQLPLAHQLIGEVALAKADLPVAVTELEVERKLNPLNAGMYDRLGDAYGRTGRYEDARSALNKAILLDPSATGPYILLGQTLLKLGEPIEAVHYLSRALAMDPNNHVTHYALGQAYSALGRAVEAHREFKMSVDMQHKTDKPVAR